MRQKKETTENEKRAEDHRRQDFLTSKERELGGGAEVASFRPEKKRSTTKEGRCLYDIG